MTALPSPRAAAVVVAAGRGQRAGGEIPKQFRAYRGKPLVRHSVEALAAAGVTPIVVVVPSGMDELAEASLAGLDVLVVQGAATRQGSVRAGLEALCSFAPASVLIHDAARPGLTSGVINRLMDGLAQAPGAIAALPVVDSLFRDGEGAVTRDGLFRVQTPQAFRFDAILAAHRDWQGPSVAGDDAEVARASGLEVALVEGDEALRKVTFASDFRARSAALPRVGSGFDVHRLTAGEELWLCGLRIAHTQGLAGHSDADVALHALTDAILGAMAAGDIGEHFPPGDPRWRGVSSDRFLAHAVARAFGKGYAVGQVDLTIICEAPRIGPHKAAMRMRVAGLLGVDIGEVSIKATTTERLGFTGRGEGIAAQAVATLYPIDDGSY